MILYAYAKMCTAGSTATNITTANVVAAITNYDLYIKQAAMTVANTTIQSGNYSSASFIVMKYAGTLGADKTAKDLAMTDLASVFYWASHLSLNGNMQTKYTAELSTWKTQTGGSYLYVRDAMMLVNMKNQGTATGAIAAKKTDWDLWLGLISGNSITKTASPSTGAVTATADVLMGVKLTNAFWAYYGDGSVSATDTPTMWKDVT